jgi:hypothetical protein
MLHVLATLGAVAALCYIAGRIEAEPRAVVKRAKEEEHELKMELLQAELELLRASCVTVTGLGRRVDVVVDGDSALLWQEVVRTQLAFHAALINLVERKRD